MKKVICLVMVAIMMIAMVTTAMAEFTPPTPPHVQQWIDKEATTTEPSPSILASRLVARTEWTINLRATKKEV
jgi:hypothetical protein